MKTISFQSLQSVMLSMRFNGNELSTGTGFFVISPIGPLLITNRHNVTGRHQVTGTPISGTCAVPNEIAIHHLLPMGDGPHFTPGWTERVERLYLDADRDMMERPAWKEHPSFGPAVDFVALPLNQTNAIEIIPYNMFEGHDIMLKPAETVSVIGFPFGMSVAGRMGIWATGFIASEPDVDCGGLPLMLIDCRTRKGQSGSPVIAPRQGLIPMIDGSQKSSVHPRVRFVGIYSGRVNEESDIGMVWKASAIQELIDSFGSSKTN